MSEEPIQAALTSLLAKWRGECIAEADAVTEDDIFVFEEAHGLKLPQEFKSYLLAANGMAPVPPNDEDTNGYSFWPLRRMRNALEEFSKAKHGATNLSPELRPFLIFADYMQWSWAFAIRTYNDEAMTAPVFRVDSPTRVTKVADTFSAFLHMYVADDDALYR